MIYQEYDYVPSDLISETLVSNRYNYTVSLEQFRYYVTCADTFAHCQRKHGPFTEGEALAMVAGRVRREEDLKK